MLLAGFGFSQSKSNLQSIIDRADSIYYSNPDSSFVLASDAYTKARDKKYEDIMANALISRSRYHLLKADYGQVRTELDKATEIYKKTGDKDGLGNAYNLKSILEDRLGRKNEALTFLNESIRLFSETGNTSRLVDMYNNLSLKYLEMEKPELAKDALLKIIPYLDRISSTSLYFYYQNNGKYFAFVSNADSAIYFLKKAHEITIEFKMRDSEITALTNLAQACFIRKDFALADKYLAEAERKAIEYKLNFELEEVYSQMAISFLSQGKSEEYVLAIQKRFDTHVQIKDIEKDREMLRMKREISTLKAGKLKYEDEKSDEKFRSHLYLILFLSSLAILLLVLFRKRKNQR